MFSSFAFQALPSPEDYGAKLKDKPVPINEDVERVKRYMLLDVYKTHLFVQYQFYELGEWKVEPIPTQVHHFLVNIFDEY